MDNGRAVLVALMIAVAFLPVHASLSSGRSQSDFAAEQLPPAELQPLPREEGANFSLLGRWTEGPCYTTAAVGGYIYRGHGPVLEVLDVSDPAHPSLVSECMLPGLMQAIVCDGSYAYVSCGPLVILDLETPAEPRIVGQWGDYRAHRVVVDGDFAFVSTWYDGLSVIDISDPTAPFEVAHLELYPGFWTTAVAKAGDYLYLDYSKMGAVIIDVSDPYDPVWIGDMPDVMSLVMDIQVIGELAFITGLGLQIYDISNVTQPVPIGRWQLYTGTQGFVIDGDRAYVAGDIAGFWVVDISDLSNPKPFPLLPIDGTTESVAVIGDVAYVAVERVGMVVVDVADPEHLSEIVRVECAGQATDIACSGTHAYVAELSNDVYVLDLSDPRNPTRVNHWQPPGSAYDLQADGDLLYVANGDDGLRIADISDPGNIKTRCALATPGSARGLKVKGDHAYIVDYVEGMCILDVSDPDEIKYIGGHDTPWPSYGIDVEGDYAFVVDFQDGMSVFDISVPSAPQPVAYRFTPGRSREIEVEGGFAFIADWGTGLTAYDVGDPCNPQLIGSWAPPGGEIAIDLTLDRGIAYLACGGVLYAVDLSDPWNMIGVGFYRNGCVATGVTVHDNLVCTSAGPFGACVLQHDSVCSVPPSSRHMLFESRPNPFNPRTTIEFGLAERGPVGLDIFAVDGRRVTSLFDGMLGAGSRSFDWNGRDAVGRRLAGGVYFARLRTAEETRTIKLVLTK